MTSCGTAQGVDMRSTSRPPTSSGSRQNGGVYKAPLIVPAGGPTGTLLAQISAGPSSG